MVYTSAQLEWIERNRSLIDSKDLVKLRSELFHGKMGLSEKIGLLAGLILIFDLSTKIKKISKNGGDSYQLYIPDFGGNKVTLIEFSVKYYTLSESRIRKGLVLTLVGHGVSQWVSEKVVKEAEYEMD